MAKVRYSKKIRTLVDPIGSSPSRWHEQVSARSPNAAARLDRLRKNWAGAVSKPKAAWLGAYRGPHEATKKTLALIGI